MPKFIKLKLNGLPKDSSPSVQWRLVIDNVEDLKKYHSLNATLNMEAFMSMERSKDGRIMLSHTGAAPTRAIVLQRLLAAKIDCTPEGEKVYPILEVASITDKKYLGMLRHINSIGAIQINEAGGYCGLDSFIDTWDAEILEVVEKDSFGFPTSDHPIISDTIILENSHKDYCGDYLEKIAQRDVKNAGTIKTIYNLREIDTSYLIKCLSACKNVVIQTQLQDEGQLSLFMGMFKRLPPKNIYLYVTKEVEAKIKSYQDFGNNSSTHNILFINA